MHKVSDPSLPAEAAGLDQTANSYLSGFYATESDAKSLIDLVERTRIEQTLSTPINNVLAYKSRPDDV